MAKLHSRKKILIFAIFLFIFDHATKFLAIKTLKYHPPKIFFNDLARLQYAENSGAFLGLGSDFHPTLRLAIFVGFVAIVLIFFTYQLVRDTREAVIPRIHYAQAAIVSGGFANLMDRIFRENHAVVDFMNIGIGQTLRTGIFNIADMAILFGFFALFSNPKQLMSSLERRS